MLSALSAILALQRVFFAIYVLRWCIHGSGHDMMPKLLV